ncbi:MAG: hypothetical protein AAF928_02530 [Myxococcota bacterium]
MKASCALSRRALAAGLLGTASCSGRGCGPNRRVVRLTGAGIERMAVSHDADDDDEVAVVGGGARGRLWTVTADGVVTERLDRLAYPRDVLVVHDRWVVATDEGVVALPRTGAGREQWSTGPAWRLAAGAGVCWIERETSAIWRRGETAPQRVVPGRPASYAEGLAMAGVRLWWTTGAELWTATLGDAASPRVVSSYRQPGEVVALDRRWVAVSVADGVVRHPDGGRIVDAPAPASLSTASGWLALASVDRVLAVGTSGVVSVEAEAKTVATNGAQLWWVDRDDAVWRRELDE